MVLSSVTPGYRVLISLNITRKMGMLAATIVHAISAAVQTKSSPA